MGYGFRTSRRTPVKRRRFTRRRSSSRRTNRSTKRIERIAKRVHFKNSELKWRAMKEVTFIQPDGDLPFSSFDAFSTSVYELAKGENSATRIGRSIFSVGWKLCYDMTNSLPHPVYVRVMVLESRNLQVAPAYDNVFWDATTKNNTTASFYLPDQYAPINSDDWRIHYNRSHFLHGSGAQGSQIEKYVMWKKHYQKRRTRLDYEGNLAVSGIGIPNTKNLFLVYFVSFPGNIIPIPAQPGATDVVYIDTTWYHYFRDV